MSNQVETEPSEARQVAERFVNAIIEHKADSFDALFREDATLTFRGDFPFSGQHVGKKAIFEDYFGAVVPYYEDGASELYVRDYIAEGNICAIEYWARNKTVSGRIYRNTYCVVIESAGDQIQHLRVHCDTAAVRKSLFG